MGSSISVTDLENGGEWKKYKVEDVIEYLTTSKLLIETMEISKYHDFLDDENYGWKYLDTSSGNFFLSCSNGEEWLGTTNGMKWVSSSDGFDWLNSKYRKAICNECYYSEYLNCKKLDENFGIEKCRKCSSKKHMKWIKTYDAQTEKWSCSYDGQEWIETVNGQKLLETENGQKWLETENGKKWIDAENGRKWLATIYGQKWISTENGQNFLTRVVGKFISDNKISFHANSDYLKKWLASKPGWIWISTTVVGKKYYNSGDFHNLMNLEYAVELCNSSVGEKYFSNLTMSTGTCDLIVRSNVLNYKSGREWIKSQNGFEFLTSPLSFGAKKHECMKKIYKWFLLDDGQNWLSSEKGQNFLSTQGGFESLLEEAGIKYIEKNINWLESKDGRRFKKYIERRSSIDSDFMATYFAKVVYERGFEDLFFPTQLPSTSQLQTPISIGYIIA
jgi:hypothetical protein